MRGSKKVARMSNRNESSRHTTFFLFSEYVIRPYRHTNTIYFMPVNRILKKSKRNGNGQLKRNSQEVCVARNGVRE